MAEHSPVVAVSQTTFVSSALPPAAFLGAILDTFPANVAVLEWLYWTRAELL